MKRILSCAVAVPVLAVSLVGCLGNDGSGPVGTASSAAAAANLPTTPVTITAANAPTVAATSVDAAFGSMSMTASFTAVQVSGAEDSTSAVALAKLLLPIGTSAIKQVAAQNAAPATVVGAATTTACTAGGSTSVDQTSSTSGSVTFTDCSYSAGSKISGTMTVGNSSSTPAGGTTGDITFDITMTSTADTITIKGDMSIAYDSTSKGTTLKGTSLVITSTAHGNRALQNYTITEAANGDVSLTFTYASTVAGGTATFTTTKPFSGTTGKYPSAGVATVTGASSTMLKLTVLGDETAAVDSQVKLEVSTDAGATYGTPSLVTWASFKLTY